MLIIEGLQDHSCESLEGGEDSLTVASYRLEMRRFPRVQRFLQFLDTVDIGKIAFVVLENDGDAREVDAMLFQVLLKVSEALDVFVHLSTFGVGDEHDPVGSLKNQFSRRVVIDLPGDGVDLELRLHPCNLSQVQGEEVEEQGSVTLGSDAGEVTDTVAGCFLVNYLEVRGLSTEPRTVVHDLAVDFLQREVDLYHCFLSMIFIDSIDCSDS